MRSETPLLHRCLRTDTGQIGWRCATEGGTDGVQFFDTLDVAAWRSETVDPERGQSVDPSVVEPVPAFWGQLVYGFAENYRGPDSEKRAPDNPMLFFKPASAVVGEREVVDVAGLTSEGARIWGESELGVVIGDDREPLGVTLANDVTMEMPGYLDQDHHLPFLKGQPGFCPCASILMPLSTLDTYKISGYHNGELLRAGSRDDQIFSWPELWTWLCRWSRPGAGDLVLIGAPRRTRPRQYVAPGDIFTTILDGVHELETHFG